MVILGIYAVILFVYFCCPKYLKLVILAINVFMPDAVPIVDEVIMVAGLLA